MNRRGQGTRARILDAAVQVLLDGGIDDVRIARVATAAGVSTASVHYHFDTSETLLAAALQAAYRIAEDARTSTKYGAGPVRERLARKIEESLPFPGRRAREWELWVELWARAARDPALRHAAHAVYAGLHTSLRDLIAEGAAAGEFTATDPDATAERILALVDGYGLRAVLKDPAITQQRAYDAVWGELAAELGLTPR
jgi:AcrR family transcriptional regulator